MRKNGKNSSDLKTMLKSVHIQNFRSLRDVELPFKPLTIIVGPNASGKSNCLQALWLMNRAVSTSKPPPYQMVREMLWIDNAKEIDFELVADYQGKTAQYSFSVELSRGKTSFPREILTVQGDTVISVARGKGTVYDEDSSRPVPYRGTELALKSAGSYGKKPVTNAIARFIAGWDFYDIDSDRIRMEVQLGLISERAAEVTGNRLEESGGGLMALLSQWASDDPSILKSVNQGLKACGGAELKMSKGKRKELSLLEDLSRPLTLDHASDGTLRLLFYNTLLYQPDLPTLIGIEEPERNLHPAVLTQVSSLLEQLAQKTYVVITTHSSQLLDCFTPESLADNLAIVLLRKKPGKGTEAISLEDIQADHEALRDWMNDFGIGNAIFHSQLLQDLMGR